MRRQEQKKQMIFGKEESWGGGQEMNANGDFC